MGSKVPTSPPNPPDKSKLVSPAPPRPKRLSINGVQFGSNEIKSVTIERNGEEICITRPDGTGRIGFNA